MLQANTMCIFNQELLLKTYYKKKKKIEISKLSFPLYMLNFNIFYGPMMASL
jgi:hypothetical protein